MNTQSPAEEKRLRWQCRRGMLELDLLLEGFLRRGYTTLDGAEQTLFAALLRQPDALLFGWLMGQSSPAEPRLARLVNRIRELQLQDGDGA